VFLWGGIGALAAAAVVLVATGVATRLPGQTATGSVSLDSTQQLQRTLAQAQALETSGKPAQALSLYHQVLQKDPTQEQALAESGWIEFEAGVSQRDAGALSRGQRDEQAAERADPGAYAPHLYLGSMLLVEQRFADAADEFASFLASSPPAAGVQRAWPFIVRAYTAAGRPVPALPAH
jgi:tetratricopeptide (TPR) repeat protein